MPRLSKSRLQDLQQCPKRLWLQVRHPELREDSAVTQLVLAAGHRVGQVARTLAPRGILIDPRVPGTDRPDLAEALRLTRELLAAAPRRPLYEATFERDGVLVRADLLLPDGGRYIGQLNAQNQQTGQGVEFDADGSVVASGQWRDGKMHGRGRQILPIGDRYEGEFVAGKRSGLGSYTWPDGD
ncbi:MAG: hypothetical protein ACLGII_06535, partial [Gammaproteobacteria bacterium]